MKLKEILVNCNLLEIIGDKDLDIQGITFDSRKADKGTLFFAVKGTQVDGHDYIDKAIEKGASAVVCEKMPRKTVDNVTYIKVDNSAYVLGVGASNFFGNPSEKLRLVGVTGTNGKTTVSNMLCDLLIGFGEDPVSNRLGSNIDAGAASGYEPALLRLDDMQVLYGE